MIFSCQCRYCFYTLKVFRSSIWTCVFILFFIMNLYNFLNIIFFRILKMITWSCFLITKCKFIKYKLQFFMWWNMSFESRSEVKSMLTRNILRHLFLIFYMTMYIKNLILLKIILTNYIIFISLFSLKRKFWIFRENYFFTICLYNWSSISFLVIY